MPDARSNLLLCYYGDDFTGSTDAMEALALNGVRTILFLDVPSTERIHPRFSDIQAFGVAGVSRSMSPQRMEEELLPVLQKLKELKTPLIHYKVCSTFDSSPQVGSIGQVIDFAKELFPGQSIPLVVGAPVLKRYVVFGQLFATVEEETFRIDRHPTMSRHPITPMDEADLRLHLKKQTESNIQLMDVLQLDLDKEQMKEAYHRLLSVEPDVLLFDTLTTEHLQQIGELIWEQRPEGTSFTIGSSGIEYALTSYWKQKGMVDPAIEKKEAEWVEQLLIVSGSCSPVTQRQIEWALDHGFTGLRIPIEQLFDPRQAETVIRNLYQEAENILKKGQSLIIYSALGPDDPAIANGKEVLEREGLTEGESGKYLGEQLGRITKKLVVAYRLPRVVIAGGDTSGYATKELGIFGLEVLSPLAPGTPLCRCYADDPAFDGLELALKGGQVGGLDFFELVKKGK